MRIPDVAGAFSIAILYPLFFRKLSDVISNKKEVDESCGGRYVSFVDDILYNPRSGEPKMSKAELQTCLDEKKKKQIKINTSRFAILLSAGLVALAFSYYVESPANTLGLGIAGVLTILDATVGYWENMNETAKLTMVGVALASLLASPKFVGKYKDAFSQ